MECYKDETAGESFPECTHRRADAVVKTILIVDDEPMIREFIGLYFKVDGFVVYEADSGEAAINCFMQKQIDLVLLDILMPGEDGIAVCSRLRSISNVPIVFLTALQQDLKALEAYQAGCDAYIVKDADPKLIVAQVKRIFERMVPQTRTIQIAGLSINNDTAEVFADGIKLNLTHREFQILLLLAQHPKKVFSREYILSSVWGYDDTSDTRVIDTHIKNLRKKLGSQGKLITTVFSMGYKLDC